jgi:hypothetical protein
MAPHNVHRVRSMYDTHFRERVYPFGQARTQSPQPSISASQKTVRFSRHALRIVAPRAAKRTSFRNTTVRMPGPVVHREAFNVVTRR